MSQEKPLIFEPYLKETLWGSRRLIEMKKIKNSAPDVKIGESWEISGIKPRVSKLKDNPEKTLDDLLNENKADILGVKNAKLYENFPLLVKFLSSSEVLSLQVHPDDSMASRFGSLGKTEMWYIMEAGKGAYVIDGFKKSADEEILKKKNLAKLVEKDGLEPYLNKISVKKGDVIFIPSGKIHAVGPNIELAEIQQSSDITYRLFDWNRLDKDGKKRELHLELGLEAIKPKLFHEDIIYPTSLNQSVPLVKSSYFSTNLIDVKGTFLRDLSEIDSFVIYLCLEGECLVNGERLEAYHSLMLRASSSSSKIESLSQKTKLLETYVL